MPFDKSPVININQRPICKTKLTIDSLQYFKDENNSFIQILYAATLQQAHTIPVFTANGQSPSAAAAGHHYQGQQQQQEVTRFARDSPPPAYRVYDSNEEKY